MAGVKGRSGGPREGSGRPRKESRVTRAKAYLTDDPDAFLRAVMRDRQADFADRITAALALKKLGPPEGPIGKKERQVRDARAVVRRALAPVKAPTKARNHLRLIK